MKFDALYMMQIVIIISLVFSLIAYMTLIRANNLCKLRHSLSISSCLSARQYILKMNIEDYTPFEKYGIWRYTRRFKHS